MMRCLMQGGKIMIDALILLWLAAGAVGMSMTVTAAEHDSSLMLECDLDDYCRFIVLIGFGPLRNCLKSFDTILRWHIPAI